MMNSRVSSSFSFNKRLPQCLQQVRSFGIHPVLLNKREAEKEWDEEKELDNKYKARLSSSKGMSALGVHFAPRLHSAVNLLNGSIFRKYKYNWENRHLLRLLFDQTFSDERVNKLGHELAAAYFVVSLGGKVGFKGIPEWFEMDEEREVDIPKYNDPKYLVEEIDLATLPIIYDGFQNFDDLQHVKCLNLSQCPHVDDWCIDRLADQFGDTLETLDISHCTRITEKGLEALVRLRSLKSLKLAGLEHLPNFQLICLLLQDSLPGITIDVFSLDK